jgi:hypothetical protein
MRANLLAVVGLLAAGAAVASAQEFTPFTSPAGRYKAVFPGEVKTDTTDIKAGKDGKQLLKLTLDTVELKGNTVFLVSFVDATDEVAKAPAAQRLDKVRDGNKGTGGKVVSEQDIALGKDKYPGRDILLETPNGYIRNRAVIAGNRLYQVMVQGSKEVVSSPSADKFIASFEITK